MMPCEEPPSPTETPLSNGKSHMIEFSIRTSVEPGKSPLGPPKAMPHAGSTTGPSKGREVPEAAPVSDEKPAQEKPDGE